MSLGSIIWYILRYSRVLYSVVTTQDAYIDVYSTVERNVMERAVVLQLRDGLNQPNPHTRTGRFYSGSWIHGPVCLI